MATKSIINSYNFTVNINGVVAQECFRVLKPDKYCAILIGDTRRNKFYIPLAYKVMERLGAKKAFAFDIHFIQYGKISVIP